MEGELDHTDDLGEDADPKEHRPHFIAACKACPKLSDEYRDEQNLIMMWSALLEQDQMLFAAGSLSNLLDSRFTIITSRCLLCAVTLLEDEQVADTAALLDRAYDLWEAFRLDLNPDAARRFLKRSFSKYYAVGGQIPDSAIELIRDRAEEISDAYDMYLSQVLEERKQVEKEMLARLEEQRRVDQFQQQVAQRANTLALIRRFTALEEGAALGWLCMAVNGANYSAEKLLYFIESLMQRLESVGLTPIATDKVGKVFDGGSEGADLFTDMQGRPLEPGVKYQMAQLGWRYNKEIVVYPMAERV